VRAHASDRRAISRPEISALGLPADFPCASGMKLGARRTANAASNFGGSETLVAAFVEMHGKQFYERACRVTGITFEARRVSNLVSALYLFVAHRHSRCGMLRVPVTS
jgi:hypothetical protein